MVEHGLAAGLPGSSPSAAHKSPHCSIKRHIPKHNERQSEGAAAKQSFCDMSIRAKSLVQIL